MADADAEKGPREFLIAAGTYDGWFSGWLWQPASRGLMERFAVTDHAGPITAVAVCSLFLLSGGVDENIRIYHAKLFRGYGSLARHKDTITCMRFSGSTHLASGDRSGVIIYSTCTPKRLEELATMQVHNGVVNDCDLHPRDPLLVLSVGADHLMRITNFGSQRTVDSRKFSVPPLYCRYSLSAKVYCVGFDRKVSIFNAKQRLESPTAEYHSKEQIHSLSFIDDAMIAIGCDNKEVRIISAYSGHLLCSHAHHLNRVKGVASGYNGDHTYSIVSVDSDGRLTIAHLHRQSVESAAPPEEVVSAEELPRPAKKQRREKQSAEAEGEVTEATPVTWQRDLKGTFVPYARDVCALIEEAYRSGASSFELPDTGKACFVLDFAKMTQTNTTAKPIRSRAIQRVVPPSAVRETAQEGDARSSSARVWQLTPLKTRKIDLRFTCLAMARHSSGPAPPRKGKPAHKNRSVAES